MEKKIKILNFQDICITNKDSSNKPYSNANFNDDFLKIVIIRNPYEYFDDLLHQYIYTEMSPQLSKETKKAMKTLSSQSFLEWFNKLNYLPLINPQTFHLDIRKRIAIAIKTLESFHYVIPYTEMEFFCENTLLNIQYKHKKRKKLLFTLNDIEDLELIDTFIGKDIELYRHSLKLWENIKENNFEPLKVKNKTSKSRSVKKRYKGKVGMLNTNTIAGWVINLSSKGSALIGIYKNGVLLEKTIANRMRPDIKQKHNHPTGLCGFRITFDAPTFQNGDIIAVKTIPHNISIALSKSAKTFLKEN